MSFCGNNPGATPAAHLLWHRSDINGGGKSFWIKRHVAGLQQQGKKIKYRKIPFREASSASTMVALLSKFGSGSASAVHLDIAHIIPASANTVLLELLVLGVIRDRSSCRVYHRRPCDLFLLEIPNVRS